MKRQVILLSCIIAVLFLIGCNKHEQNSEKPIYNTNTQPGSENVSGSGPGSVAKPYDDTGKFNLYTPDFKGISPTGEAPKAANSPCANISAYGTAPIISYDEESDTLYYVNYGGRHDKEKDFFLYSYKEGERQLLIEMPVNYPNYQNGSIYFTSNEDIDALYAFSSAQPEGKLYRYDITGKTIELLVDENVFNLVVYEEYIYYTTSPAGEYDKDGNYIPKGWENYRLSTTNGKSEPIGNLLPFFYGEYQLRRSPANDENLYYMELVSEDNSVRITGNCEILADQTFCIAEDKFWIKYSENGKNHLASIDLRNGETKTYQHDSNVGIVTYAVLNGELFALSSDSNKNRIIRFDSEDKSLITVDLSERMMQPYHILTDGKYVYAQYLITNGIKTSDQHLYLTRLIPLENGRYKEEAIY